MSASDQAQILDMRAQGVVDPGPDFVRTVTGCFSDLVCGMIDEVPIIADPAAHDVPAGTAVEYVVATAAGDRVVAGTAVEFVTPAATADFVRAPGAAHGIFAGGTVQGVVTGPADELIVEPAARHDHPLRHLP